MTAQLWDLYLVNQDPWIIFFMVTVMLVRCVEGENEADDMASLFMGWQRVWRRQLPRFDKWKQIENV